jgi:hypothetical protein
MRRMELARLVWAMGGREREKEEEEEEGEGNLAI